VLQQAGCQITVAPAKNYYSSRRIASTLPFGIAKASVRLPLLQKFYNSRLWESIRYKKCKKILPFFFYKEKQKCNFAPELREGYYSES